jgi:hypothetical protein
MTSNEQPPPAPLAPAWAKPTAVAGFFGTVLVGATLGWLTGVDSKLDAHNEKIQGLEFRAEQQGKQLDRIEAKLDQIQKEAKRP